MIFQQGKAFRFPTYRSKNTRPQQRSKLKCFASQWKKTLLHLVRVYDLKAK